MRTKCSGSAIDSFPNFLRWDEKETGKTVTIVLGMPLRSYDSVVICLVRKMMLRCTAVNFCVQVIVESLGVCIMYLPERFNRVDECARTTAGRVHQKSCSASCSPATYLTNRPPPERATSRVPHVHPLNHLTHPSAPVDRNLTRLLYSSKSLQYTTATVRFHLQSVAI